VTKCNDVDNYRVNVVLSNLLSKWFPVQLLAVHLRREGNGLYSEKTDSALEKYNKAIQIGMAFDLFIEINVLNEIKFN
jgi:hypothetical protein